MKFRHDPRYPRPRGHGRVMELALNIVIVVLLLVVGYFSYAFISRNFSGGSVQTDTTAVATKDIIQIDILNGCGAKGIGAKLTNYLRSAGFDVVEAKNYKTFSIPQTLVIDRVGNLAAARRVGAALGVGENNIIQQINPDYFVDISVIIGGDYLSLKALQ